MKNKILYIIIILCCSINFAYAQRDRIEYLPNFDKRLIHFGYYVGLNNNSYRITYNSPFEQNPIPPLDKELFVKVNQAIGFNIGFVVDLRLHKNINLRFEPGLMSNKKDLEFLNANIDPFENPNYNGTTNTTREVSSTFLHLPLLFKFSTDRLNNFRPYVIGGASYDYNFSSNEDNKDDNYSNEFRTTTHNFMYEVGIGVDFYFYYFKFSPSLRGVFAINDELVNDNNPDSPWTSPVDSFKTRGVYLNLTFE